jgi:hypothetical protein
MAWTAAKRKSAQGYTLGLMTPWPDVAKPVGWRAAVAWLYSADSYPTPSTPTSGLNWSTGLNAGLSGLNIGAKLDIGTGLSLCIAWLLGDLRYG